MAAQGIIFDMDGVIFDSERVWKDCSDSLNADYGISFSEEYRQNLCGMGEPQIREKMKNDFPSLDVDRYRDELIRMVTERILIHVPMKPFLMETIGKCRAMGYRMALATSSNRSRAATMFNQYNLVPETLFDGTVYGEDVAKSKPHPEIFLRAASKIGVEPENCFVLEDSLNGLIAAFDGGFKPVMIVDMIPPSDYVREHGIPVFYDLNKFAVALEGDQ